MSAYDDALDRLEVLIGDQITSKAKWLNQELPEDCEDLFTYLNYRKSIRNLINHVNAKKTEPDVIEQDLIDILAATSDLLEETMTIEAYLEIAKTTHGSAFEYAQELAGIMFVIGLGLFIVGLLAIVANMIPLIAPLLVIGLVLYFGTIPLLATGQPTDSAAMIINVGNVAKRCEAADKRHSRFFKDMDSWHDTKSLKTQSYSNEDEYSQVDSKVSLHSSPSS